MDAFGFPWIIIETVGRRADGARRDPPGGHDGRRAGAGVGRLDPGHEGRAHGGGGHLRGQQGRPRRRRTPSWPSIRFSVHLQLHERRRAQGRGLGDAGPRRAGRQRRGRDGAPGRRSCDTAPPSTQAGALEKRRRARRRAELEALLVEELTAQVMARAHADPRAGAHARRACPTARSIRTPPSRRSCRPTLARALTSAGSPRSISPNRRPERRIH